MEYLATGTPATTISPSSTNFSFAWYEIIGPLLGLVFISTLFLAFCKCLIERCKEGIFGSRERGQSSGENRNASYDDDFDLPPRYSTSGIANVDFENNVIVETSSERQRRERRLQIDPEEKLPSYSEIIEDDRKQKQNKADADNPAFERGEHDAQDERSVSESSTVEYTPENDTRNDLDQVSIVSESDLPPPPSYEAV